MRPLSAGGSGNGTVTSTVSVLSRTSSACSASAALRDAKAAVMRSLSPLICGPCSRRCSGVIVPSVLSSSDTEPLRPNAAIRTASSAASSDAAAIAAWSSCSSVCRSDTASLRHVLQIGIVRLATGLRQHAVHLAAMMRLVIEQLGDQQPLWFADVAVDGVGVPGQIALKCRGREIVGPVDDRDVGRGALAPQQVPVLV